MYRFTARLLLVLLLAGTLVPAAMAVSGATPQTCCMRKPAPDGAGHACCMRKSMHDHSTGGREVSEVGGRTGNCCCSVTTASWAELESEIDSNVRPHLSYLLVDAHPILHSDYTTSLRPVRGPPLG